METKYSKATDYFFRKMKNGLIEDDKQQEVYETAIGDLSTMNKLIELAQQAIDSDDMEEYKGIQELVREEIRKENA
ncbi:hypothetical protein [Clostridium beijerinckii]|uniref:hypothetical protein n=1 Tax=Clostridium beijerinckii TaxID=1520 RepID=UPI001F43914F|nr:hypothetical protein [Clostridium beijerinckii]